MLAEVYEVNVQKDLADWLIFGLTIIVGVASVIALRVSVLALREATAARKAIAKERKRQFELEILRDILKDIDEHGLADQAVQAPYQLGKYIHRLDLLQSDELPFWRQAVRCFWPREMWDLVDYTVKIEKASEENFTLSQRTDWASPAEQATALQDSQKRLTALQRDVRAVVQGRLVGELRLAIKRRVDAEDS